MCCASLRGLFQCLHTTSRSSALGPALTLDAAGVLPDRIRKVLTRRVEILNRAPPNL